MISECSSGHICFGKGDLSSGSYLARSLIWLKISSLLEESTILLIILTGEYASIFPFLLMGVGP